MRVGEHRDDLSLRVRVLSGAALLALGALAVAFWVVQGVHGASYREQAENNRLRDVPIRAPRGLIYDRRDRLLVENVPSYNLLLDRSRVRDLPTALGFAASVLDKSSGDLARLLERYRATPAYTPVLLAEGLTLAQVSRFGVASLDFPAFEVEIGHQRLYRQADHLAHVIGYLGEVSAEELANSKYRSGEMVGKKGVEQRYDESLRGADGRRVVVVDSRGRPLQEHEKRPAQPGQTLRLTIDLALQQAAERALADNVGAAVAIDPQTGEILALVSTPAYDPNAFARRLSPEIWSGLLADTRHPLQNRTIQNTYSPGSVFKTIVAMAALTEGVATPSTRVFCSGQTTVFGHPFRCHKRGGHGSVDVHDALRESCDIWFYHVGSKLGVNTIARYARLFGLGSASGIDLAGEKAGLVPDEDWSLKVRKHPWYPGETVSVSIGQGPLLVTPLQMAVWVAAIANGGYRVTPHLVAGGSGSAPQKLPVDAEALAVVRRGLWAVVNEQGTGATVKLDGVEVAGKTSTVQVISQKTWTDNASLPYELRDHAWFASFAPAGLGEKPKIAIVVFVEHGGRGSQAATPVAKAMYETYFRDQLDRQRPL
jgi:penicillin-binding protein 2